MNEINNDDTERGGKITRLLCDGSSLKLIALKTKRSYISIYKLAKKYERAGLIVQVSKYPLLFTGKIDFTPPLKGVGDFTPPLLLPHKLGASFLQFGRPKVPFSKLGKATIKEGSHTIQYGKTKAVIWLHSFRGENPKEIMQNAGQDIKALAVHYSQKHGVKLVLSRVFQDTEWILNDNEASEEMAFKCGIQPSREIADALFKFDDFSHPHKIEINQAPNKPPEIPSQHAETLHYLLTACPALLRQLTETSLSLGERIRVLEQK